MHRRRSPPRSPRPGRLGSVAGEDLSPEELRAEIREVRAATDRPFAVNLFAPPYLDEAGLEVVLEERPPVFSFAFGIVEPAPLREAGLVTLGTATTADEARALEQAGVDAVVAQGAEAGGHRGSFLGGFPLVPLAELVTACVDAVSLPVVAAGGIVDGTGIAQLLGSERRESRSAPPSSSRRRPSVHPSTSRRSARSRPS